MNALADVVSLDNLMAKAEKLQERNFRPGFDKMTPEAAILWLRINGSRLVNDLLSGRYEPLPAFGFISAKKDGTYRNLSRCAALDMIIQSCLLENLNQLCETFFSDFSYAYRSGRGVSAALAQYLLYADKYAWASRMDPKGCFDHVNHAILEEKLRNLLDLDEPYFQLIMKYVRMPVLAEGVLCERKEGILQGSPLSTVLCNLYFHDLDRMLSEKGIPFVRFGDDIMVFADRSEAIHQAAEFTAGFLSDQLCLTVNRSKFVIGSPLGIQFLGHSFHRDRHGIISLKANDSIENAFYSWHESKIERSHRAVDILTNGILRQKDYSLLFESEDQKQSLPVSAIDMINVYSSVIMDSNFFKKVAAGKVYVNVFDEHGGLLGRFIPDTALKSPVVTHEQLTEYYQEEARIALAKEFVLASIHNCRIVIRYFQKHHPQSAFELSIEALNDNARKIGACTDYERLLLFEAASRKEYYDCFDFFINNDAMLFDKRLRQPPGNEVNSLISFGNTFLYNIIAHRINTSPLDVRIGFLHATNTVRKETLNLDIAEIFKPLIVDRAIFSCINLKMIDEDDFRREENGGVYLTENGKKIFLRKLYEKLDDTLQINGRPFSYSMLIDEEIRKLVRHFRNHEPYKAYRQVR